MPFKDEPRACEVEGCTNRATFYFQVVLGTLQRKPKYQLSSKTVGLCDSCLNRQGPLYDAFKRAVAARVGVVRYDMLRRLEDFATSALPEDAQRVYSEQRGEKSINHETTRETESPSRTVLSTVDREPIADGSTGVKSGEA